MELPNRFSQPSFYADSVNTDHKSSRRKNENSNSDQWKSPKKESLYCALRAMNEFGLYNHNKPILIKEKNGTRKKEICL